MNRHLPLKSLLISPQRLSSRSRYRFRIRISPSSPSPPLSLFPLTPTSSSLLNIRSPIVKRRNIHQSRIPPHILRKRIPMLLQLMCLEINFGIKSNKFLLQTFPLITHKVVLPKMRIQRLVIEVVLRLATTRAITDKAPLMLIPTMNIQLIFTIKPQSTEGT
jgi:hypothetical protein